MLKRTTSVIIIGVVAAVATTTVAATRANRAPSDPTIAHEWGTFTTVAGQDGRAIDWLPLAGPTDLPCFVEHFQRNPISKLLPGEVRPVTYATAQSSMRAKVRMETPVLYFYGPRDMAVNVRVRFPRGLLTEWYPHAVVSQGLGTAATLRDPKHVGVIEWKNVRIGPSDVRPFPAGYGKSHYYAARNTDAAPLSVGAQSERFLFYRGVADFDVPLAAAALPNGDIRVSNLSSDTIPAVVLFERRGGKLGYRLHHDLRGDVTLAPPSLDGSFATLRADLEQILIRAGMYPKEAAAMVETWRNSWFEEGTRVFYLVPPRAVDAILPLEIQPEPVSIARAFVGRMEVLTPAIQQDVENAIARNDTAALTRHGRFLGPITDRILAAHPDSASRQRIETVASATFAA
jgi:hypothetical protein